MNARGAKVLEACAVALLLSLSFIAFASPSVFASSTACGVSISTSTTLTGNVGPCPGNGLIISGNNVVLNCNGYTVTGSPDNGGTGIQTAPGVSGATIENCRVTNFIYGILLGNGGGDSIIGNQVVSNTVFGFFIVSHSSFVVNNVALKNAQAGFAFYGCNLGSECPGGISFGYGNQVTNNKAVDNGQNSGNSGFGFLGTVGDTLTNNKAVNNLGNGFTFGYNGGSNPATGNTLTSNKAVHNGAFGFFDDNPGFGTSGTANTYYGNVCQADASGPSSPPGLC